jgi:hypothetical protein
MMEQKTHDKVCSEKKRLTTLFSRFITLKHEEKFAADLQSLPRSV